MVAASPPAHTDDRLLGGRVLLRQPVAGYRAAIDPVLMAAAVPVRPGERVLELGCGAGAAALCLLARVPGSQVVGLELQPELTALARHNAVANAAALTVLEGDVANPPASLGTGFDRAMLNPPFLPPSADASPLPAKDLANRESAVPLALWLRLGLDRLRPGGTLTLIHLPERLGEILALLERLAGDLRVFPLWPGGRAAPPKPARRILIRATVGSRAPLALLPGLVLHGPDGGFTPAAEAALRDAAPLDLEAAPAVDSRIRGKSL